jgi:colicin import membrane protein
MKLIRAIGEMNDATRQSSRDFSSGCGSPCVVGVRPEITMGQLETSTLSSLKELMRLQEERVRQEQEQQEQRAHDAASARRRRREAQEARVRELERVLAEEDRQKREEELRFEAIREAELERARNEALERTRAEERAHEQRLAQLASDATQTKLRVLRWGAAAGLAWVALSALLYFGKIKPSTEERARSLQSIIEARQHESEQLRGELELRSQKLVELEERLRQQVEAAKAQAAVNEQEADRQREPRGKKARAGRPARRHKGRGAKVAAPCTCDPHDPMCGCFTPP